MMTTCVNGDNAINGGKMAEQEVLPSKAMQCETLGGGDGEVAVLKKGKWTEEEDEKLSRAVVEYGIENWVAIEKYSGLARQSKSCRLRWINHLRPHLKKGPFTEEEERIIVKLHFKFGNRWSRIASKLPGRTDNEIKNFWHKRVKKCRKHHRPVYPAYTEEDPIPANIPKSNNDNKPYTGNGTHVDDGCGLDDPDFFTQPNSVRLPNQSQFSLQNLPNTARYRQADPASNSAASGSPQMLMSSLHNQQQYFNIAPQESIRNDFIQSCYQPNAPLQSLYQSTEAPVSPLMEITSSIQLSSLRQQGIASNDAVTPFTNPPFLSAPNGQFGRFHRATLSSPQVSTFGATSPVPPLKLDSLSLLSSLPKLQFDSPTAASLSTLKFHSSPAGRPEFCTQSDFSSPDSWCPLKVSTAAPPLSSPHSETVPLGLDLQPIQPSSSQPFQLTPRNSSFTDISELPSIQFSSPAEHYLYKSETDNNLKALDTLKDAQAKARFRRKNLRLSRISNKRIFLDGTSREAGFFSASTEANDIMLERPMDRNSTESSSSRTSRESLGVNVSSKNSNTRDLLRIIPRKNSVSCDLAKQRFLVAETAVQENEFCNVQKTEDIPNEKCMPEVISIQNPQYEELVVEQSSEIKTTMCESLQMEMDSVAESMTFHEQRHKVDLHDAANSKSSANAPFNMKTTAKHPIQVSADELLSEYQSKEDFSSKSSQIFYLQDNFSMDDMFGESSLAEQVPFLDAFGPLYSQSTATALLKSCDGSRGQLSFLEHNDNNYFGAGFQTEFTDSLERKSTEEQNLEGDSEMLELHE